MSCLKDILPVGLHKLSAVEPYQRKDEYTTYDGYYVVIDNIVYAFELDPCDGYRSYCDIQIVDIPLKTIKNHFPEQDVFIVYNVEDSDDCDKKKYYTIRDVNTGKKILEIGTDYFDGYYPIAIFHYYPENLTINNEVKNAEEQQLPNINNELENNEWITTHSNTFIDYNTNTNINYLIV